MSFTRALLAVGAALALSFSVPAMADNPPASSPAAAASSSEKNATQKVNVNTATVEQLTTLKGVGESKAQSILDYRTQHGAFKTVDELAKVKGIGDKTLATLVKKNPGRIVVQ